MPKGMVERRATPRRCGGQSLAPGCKDGSSFQVIYLFIGGRGREVQDGTFVSGPGETDRRGLMFMAIASSRYDDISSMCV